MQAFKFLSFFALSIFTHLSFSAWAGGKWPNQGMFVYDDPEKATGLHVSFEGHSQKDPSCQWKADSSCLKEKKEELFSKILGNPQIMKNFGQGNPYTNDTVKKLADKWIESFKQGTPNAGLLVTDPTTKELIGFAVVRPLDNLSMSGVGTSASNPGIGDIAFAYGESYASQGIGTSLGETLIKEWAPRVRNIGLGKGLDEIQDLPIIQNFCCFHGEALKKICATARPSNPGSWRVLEKIGFENFKDGIQEPPAGIVLNCQNPDVTRDNKIAYLEALQTMEEEIIEHYQAGKLEEDVKYWMTDLDDKLRVVSYKSNFKQLRWHVAHPIE